MLAIVFHGFTARKRPLWTLQNLPFQAHDLIYFPLPFLSQILITTGKLKPEETEAALTKAAQSLGQKKPAARALTNLRHHTLQQAVIAGRYQAARTLKLNFFSGAETKQDPWFLFCDIAAALHSYQLQTNTYGRRSQLEAAFTRVNELKNQLTAYPDDRNPQMFRTLATFRQACEREKTALEAQEAANPTIPAPFVTGPALRKGNEAVFVGRDQTIHTIDHLLAPQRSEPLLLRGQRRMGKSSLINMLPERLADTTFVQVSFQELDAVPERLARPDAWIVTETAAALGLDPPETPDWGASLAWLEQLQPRLESENRRLLICIDEVEGYQTAVDMGQTDLLKLIRLCGDRLSRVRFLLASAYPLTVLGDAWADKLISHREIPVAYLSAEVAKTFIRQPIPGFPDIFEEDGVDYLYSQTKGHPYFTQVVCDQLVDRLNGASRFKAKFNDLETAIDLSLDAGGTFSNIWRNLINTDQQHLLQRAAQGDTLPENKDTRELERLHFLEPSGDGYALIMPMFGLWVQRNT